MTNLKEKIRIFKQHKMRICECCVCGMLVSPFYEELKFSLEDGYGWHQLKDGRWLCHQCADHTFAERNSANKVTSGGNSSENISFYDHTKWVVQSNDILYEKILYKDKDFCEKHFERIDNLYVVYHKNPIEPKERS